MKSLFKILRNVKFIASTFSIIFMGLQAFAEPKHGISMYGKPQLPADFTHLPYANPDAPKGGEIAQAENGSFDSLSPYILKGRAPWGVRSHVYESLLGRNWNESFALYGLLAETVEVGPDREWVEFKLRPEAKFSDGAPVTIDDVIWSMETLAKANGRYARSWDQVKSVDRKGEDTVRFTFNTVNLELPLILGLRPIFKKADWDNREFTEASMEVPHGSGPYVIGKHEAGRYIEFDRNPDYWGKDLAFNKGMHNVDIIRYDYFSDSNVIFQNLIGGETSFYREVSPSRWETEYDFPAIKTGDIIKEEIPHQRPSGMHGLVFNMRKPIFQDIRVREALIYAFNFEFINQAENNGKLLRVGSYFSNSFLGMPEGPASPEVIALLEPYKTDLPEGVFDAITLPASVKGKNDRKNLRKAKKLLAAAGWTIQDGILKNAAGVPFSFELLLGKSKDEPTANMYLQALKRLGVSMNVSLVDNAQYKERTQNYSYDMIFADWNLSLSPGNEQKKYWGSQGVTEDGSRNYMGVNSPAIDAMIDKILSSKTHDEFVFATQALDRVLMAGKYVIPTWYSPISRMAYKKELKHPDTLPIYGDWIGFMPDVWWVEN